MNDGTNTGRTDAKATGLSFQLAKQYALSGFSSELIVGASYTKEMLTTPLILHLVFWKTNLQDSRMFSIDGHGTRSQG